MVTMRKFILFAGIFLLLGMYGCSSATSDKPMPDIGINSEDINTQFTVKALPDMNNFRTDDSVQIVVDVISDNVIEFPPDFGVRMFIWENDEWAETENLFMMYPPGNVRIPRSSIDHGTTSVFPKIADQNEKALVRIILIGQIVQNGVKTEDKAASYIDIQLHP